MSSRPGRQRARRTSPLSVEDTILARRELRNVLEEVDQVKTAMTIVYGES